MSSLPTHEKQNPLGQWMLEHGITSREVALALDVSSQAIGNWRRGPVPEARIASFVGVLEEIAADRGLPAEGLRDLIPPCAPRTTVTRRDRRLCGFAEGRGTPFDQLVAAGDDSPLEDVA